MVRQVRDIEFRVCSVCKQEKPGTEYIKLNSAQKTKKDGTVSYYVYRETKCNSCRRKKNAAYQKTRRDKKICQTDNNGFWFKDDIKYWISSADHIRWARIYKDKKDREELREGPFARV